MSARWRVRVAEHWNFAADQVNVWVGQRNDLGEVRMVQAIHMDKEVTYPEDVMFVLGDPIDGSAETEPTFTIARELAQALFEALTPMMIGTDSANILQAVANLRRERDDANQRFDRLLDVLYRLGHDTSSLARATAPRGNPPPPLSHPV